MKKQLISALVLTAASACASAGAITTFGNLGAYQTAIGAATETVEDFTNTSHFPISTGILNSATNLPGIGIAPGDIKAGVTYSTPIGSSFFFNIDAGGGFIGGFLDGFYGGDPNRTLNVAFNSAAGAFGFDTNSLMGPNFGITINFATGPAFSGNFSVNGDGFFGFQSDATDITSVIIDGSDGGFAFALDNFRFSNATGANRVPEPAGLAFLGFAALLATARRKRK